MGRAAFPRHELLYERPDGLSLRGSFAPQGLLASAEGRRSARHHCLRGADQVTLRRAGWRKPASARRVDYPRWADAAPPASDYLLDGGREGDILLLHLLDRNPLAPRAVGELVRQREKLPRRFATWLSTLQPLLGEGAPAASAVNSPTPSDRLAWHRSANRSGSRWCSEKLAGVPGPTDPPYISRCCASRYNSFKRSSTFLRTSMQNSLVI